MMVALLVAMGVMMIAMTAALPAWQTAARREKEAELIFRGKQYARALSGFQRKYAGAYPPTVDVLINERFLRKKYKDPITQDDFVFVSPGSELPTTTTSPFGVSGSTRPGGLNGSSTLQTSGARGGTNTGAATSSSQTSQIGRGMTLGATSNSQNTQAGRPGSTTGGGGTGTGIMAVYSKSKDKSLRVYNGYDHYNEWVFVGTAATQTLTSPTGGQVPGSGTRGGAAGTRGGQPTGRGGTGGRGGLQPPPAPAPPGGRGAGPGANPFGGPGGFPGRGGR
jgi:type II secretory pathway pseudopilin PulG